MNTLIICNPDAGSVDDAAALLDRLSRVDSAIVKRTSAPGEATMLAHEAVHDGYDMVVAAGGDGTLNEVINGIAEHTEKIKVGLVPLGTGNDFARMLALPDSIDGCIDVLNAGCVRQIDLVRVTSDQIRYFVNVSAGGFSGTVGEKLTAEIKKSWGPLAYLRCAAEALPELRAYRTQIVFDDTSVLELDLYNAIIANGRYVAGGTPVAPEAAIDDGLLDVVLVPEAPAGNIAVVVAQIMLGKHLASETIVFRRAAKVSIHSTPGMWFNVDGELVGNDPAVFEVIPRALQFVVPNNT
ncbi:MAG: diacylglycerol kinase family lipid kinase [Chthoniobacterales bacterium]|nr:diacylglycerol kinase family lipid kinase [Chthoniobacterales bacterium]